MCPLNSDMTPHRKHCMCPVVVPTIIAVEYSPPFKQPAAVLATKAPIAYVRRVNNYDRRPVNITLNPTPY